MKAIFADSFYWVALTNPADPYNALVTARTPEIAHLRIVTTDSVLTEFLTFFSRDLTLRKRAEQTVRTVFHHPNIEAISESRSTFLSGLELYASRPDKRYSLTDCISMQTMRREGITDVLTNDRHFEQEGFHALFRDL